MEGENPTIECAIDTRPSSFLRRELGFCFSVSLFLSLSLPFSEFQRVFFKIFSLALSFTRLASVFFFFFFRNYFLKVGGHLSPCPPTGSVTASTCLNSKFINCRITLLLVCGFVHGLNTLLHELCIIEIIFKFSSMNIIFTTLLLYDGYCYSCQLVTLKIEKL